MNDEEKFAMFRKIGKQVAEELNLHYDRLGFFQTKLGMKTAQGIGEIVYDIVRREDINALEKKL